MPGTERKRFPDSHIQTFIRHVDRLPKLYEAIDGLPEDDNLRKIGQNAIGTIVTQLDVLIRRPSVNKYAHDYLENVAKRKHLIDTIESLGETVLGEEDKLSLDLEKQKLTEDQKREAIIRELLKKSMSESADGGT